jgi:aflatoxin B1 aldehyde reductase
MPTPNILFGAGGIGEGRISHTWVTPSQVSELLVSLEELGLKQLDSGASYPPGSPWVTETLLGQSKAAEKGFVIDSKVLVTGSPPGAGHLSQENIRSSVRKTLDLLGVEKVGWRFRGKR